MSESKSRLAMENAKLKRENSDLFFQLVRLVTYVHNVQMDHPDLDWPELPDTYSEAVWRYAA